MNLASKHVLWQRAALLLLLAAASLRLEAQAPAKRPLTHADADSWRSIQGQQLSRDGRFLAYALVPQEGDGEVVARNLATGAEWRHTRGARPEPTGQGDLSEPEPRTTPVRPRQRGSADAGGAGYQMSISADGRALAFLIYPSKADTDAARRQRKRPDEMPKNGLAIMDLETGTVTRIERVKRFILPEEGGGFIAYSLEPKAAERPADERRAEAPTAEQPVRRRPAQRRKEYGTELVVRSLRDGSARSFADVLDFTFSKDGATLLYTVSSRREETNGLFALDPASGADPKPILSGSGRYVRPTWDENNRRLAFLSDRDDGASRQPRLKLYGWERAGETASELVSTATAGFPAGRVVSERGAISFSQDGTRVFFGLSPPPEPERDASAPAEERPVFDLWHWKDDYIQPMQKVRAESERNRSYRAVFHLDAKKLVPLADETMPDAQPARSGPWALGSDDRAYRRLVGYETSYADLYAVDTRDGSRRALLRKHLGAATWSPMGRYLLLFDGRDWNTLSVADGKITNLTRSLGVRFQQEEHDTPGPASSHGNAGWTSDDRYVLIYDRYDIWQIAPDGSIAKNLTDGVGRRDKIALRYVRLDPQERAIDPARPLLLAAEDETTRDSGFYRDRIDGGLPERLVMAPKSFSAPAKAKGADVFLLTASTFSEFPDLMVCGPSLRDMKKVSSANPQREQLLWGSAELVRYKSLDGVPLSGMLIKPEKFDPKKKYPMLVYIYERLSQGLHRFVDPRPRHSINASYYASNGYLVLQPDIVYTVGYPGASALKCVLPAIQAVVDRGYVDDSAIGIQGHSWGGYQIAYMVTQTNRFRAAAPGALVANMTSAYSGIRWGTGTPRQFQYERTQSRIGGNLWEYPMRFLENSPVFRADRVQTPILMLHNDGDDAVPWYQGIEYYLALRRLGKEAYMFNYNGEPHGLRKRVNQKDYTIRLQQFFDHYLKGAPKPDWMARGIPYLERDKQQERPRPATDVKN